MSKMTRITKSFAALLVAAAITGCAHSPNDPLEGYNRQAFYFNEMLDTVVMKPVAHGYNDLVPDPVQSMVSNFFSNISDVWIAFNNFLQGRGDEGFSDVSRIIINTFAGIGGVIDVASELGLPKHNEDFGQTLGVWGIDAGPYVVLPILGPSTVRDTVAAPADYWFGDPWSYISHTPTLWGGEALRGISKRAELLDASSVIEDAAIDKYEFMRDAYLQMRQRMVHDRDLNNDDWEPVDAESVKRESQQRRIEGQMWLPSSHNQQQKAADKLAVNAVESEEQVAAAADAAEKTATDETIQTQGPVSDETAALID